MDKEVLYHFRKFLFSRPAFQEEGLKNFEPEEGALDDQLEHNDATGSVLYFV